MIDPRLILISGNGRTFLEKSRMFEVTHAFSMRLFRSKNAPKFKGKIGDIT